MKKKFMLGMLALTMGFGLSGCGGTDNKKEPTEDANKIVGVQKEDVHDDEGKYYYTELDVKKFDPSKFDGVLRLDARYAFKGDFIEVKTPVTFAQLQEAGLFFVEDALDANKLQEIASDSGESISPSLYANNENADDGTVIVVDTVIPCIQESGLTYQQILDKGTFLLYREDDFLGDIIHTDLEDPDTTDFKDVVKVLGPPSMIMGDAMSLDGDLSSGSFSYIYKYDDCALIFSGLEFTGDDDTGTFYEFYYASNEEALNTYIDFMKASEYEILAQ